MLKKQSTLGMYARTQARRYFNRYCKGNPELCQFLLEESWLLVNSTEFCIKIKEDIEKGIIRVPQSMQKELRAHLKANMGRDEAIYTMVVDHIQANLDALCTNELAFMDMKFAK